MAPWEYPKLKMYPFFIPIYKSKVLVSTRRMSPWHRGSMLGSHAKGLWIKSRHNRIPRSIKSPSENPLSGDYNKQMTPIRNFGHNFFFEIRLSQNFRKAKALN